MSQIKVSNLTFSYDNGSDLIFDNVSLSLDSAWRLGLVGRNGRGKTTFLKLLLGQNEYNGSITSNEKFEYFPPDIENEEETVLDAVLSLAPTAQLWQVKKELNLLKVDEGCLYMRLCDLSGGERTKVCLAGLFLKESSFLLIDEPTNHLDLMGRAAVSSYLSGKQGFILVSHDKAFLDESVDHIMAINRADIEVQSGNFSSWQSNRELQDEFEQNQNEKLNAEIKRLKEAAIDKAEWSRRAESQKLGQGVPDRGFIGHKAAKIMQAAKNIERRQQNSIKAKGALLKNIELDEELLFNLNNDTHFEKARLLEVKDFSVRFDERTIFSSLSFCVNGGDRVWLKGGNGSGKTALIKSILSNSHELKDKIIKKSGLKISYLSQSLKLDSISFDDYIAENELDRTQFFTLLAKLGVDRTHYDSKLSQLSLGQKKKVMIASSLLKDAHLFIWDEPLNYIDLFSRMQIEKAILSFKPTIIFVEHDKAFSEKIATKTVDLSELKNP